jgi:divalent metal cation (Fe/Co/Zn/Cd) transporter
MTETSGTPGNGERARLARKGLRLEYLTVGYNVVEAVIAITFGTIAGSIALIGFGFDSVIELTAGGILIWRLRKHGMSPGEETAAERKALLVVGITFFLLAIYILFHAGHILWMREAPDESPVGIGLAILSLIVMPVLGLAKRKVGRDLGSRALMADAMCTLVCAWLSLTLLLGLGLNVLFGWWWADPLAALAMLYLVIREGWEAVQGGLGKGSGCCCAGGDPCGGE